MAALVGWLTFLPTAALSGVLFDLGGVALLTVPLVVLTISAGAIAFRGTQSAKVAHALAVTSAARARR